MLMECFHFQMVLGPSFDKNVIILRINNSFSTLIDNRNKYILILGKTPTQGLDNTTLAAEPLMLH